MALHVVIVWMQTVLETGRHTWCFAVALWDVECQSKRRGACFRPIE